MGSGYGSEYKQELSNFSFIFQSGRYAVEDNLRNSKVSTIGIRLVAARNVLSLEHEPNIYIYVGWLCFTSHR